MKKKYFFAFAMFLALTTQHATAQITYTDIPDGQPAGLDFNQDGTNEFDITSQNKLGDYISYFEVTQGLENNIHTLNGDTPALVAQGFPVDASNNWAGGGDAYPNGDWNQPPGNPTIIPGADQYLAVRFSLAPNLGAGAPVFYGWVRVNIDPQGNVTYKDYAYNTTAGEPIEAGQQVLSVAEFSKNAGFNFYPNPSNGYVNIKNDSSIKITNLKVVNTLGQTVLKVNNVSNGFSTNSLTSGVYLVSAYHNKQLLSTKKLLVQ